MSQVYLSVVVPAYNEERRIGHSLQAIDAFLGGHAFSSELIVVDDGSTDATAEVVNEYALRHPNGLPLRAVQNRRNRGKGFSVRKGFLESRGELVMFTDVDLSAPLEEIPKLLACVVDGSYDIALASRAVQGSHIEVHQPLFRELSGRIFNLAVRWWIGLPFRDTQCGLKVFRRSRVQPVFERATVEGFGFDVELLFIARKHGLRMVEVPVTWRHSPSTTVRFFTHGPRMLADLWTIKMNDWRGKY